MLFPLRAAGAVKLKNVQQWLIQDAAGLTLFAHPFVAQRARQEELGLPELKTTVPVRAEVREADGPLLGVVLPPLQ